VRRQAAVTTGLDQTLAASKLKLEEKANEAIDHIKGVVVRMSAVAALAVAAAILRCWRSSPGLWRFTRGWSPPMGNFRRSLSLAGFWL
jgi:hypothetical protein